MTVVLVHGVPESAAIWNTLVAELRRHAVDDVVTLSPPGFGVPAPEGWEPTADNYRAWLIEQLEQMDGPIDVVGHDWGAGHVYGMLAERPDLVRSWSADIAGLIHPDYVWHDMAQAWQTPDVGEQVIEAMTSQPVADRAAGFEALGFDAATATGLATALDAEMGACILGLYRSAVQPYCGNIGLRLSESELPPGLVIDATADDFIPRELSLSNAEAFGANVLTLDDQGHWWTATAAGDAAAGLAEFWNGL